MSRGRNILSNAEKEKLAESRKQVAKVLERDANISGRDLFDRLLRQARMQEQELYEEKLADNALIRQRPASFSEVPGGYTPMPAALQQAAQGEYYHSFQGLFPQIHRAWMTIDHVLYLWDYNDPRGSFYLYDGLDQTIIHASLVKSRQGVFEPTPDWLLLLSTPVEVILLGLYRTATDDIDVFETGYSVATDGANLLQIVGTPSGRIFMAGADGFVYELTYGESEGWFYTNKKCTKRNRSRKRDVALQYLSSVVYDSSDPILDLVYDAERKLLYTLSRASTLQLFDLGGDGEGPVRFVTRLEAKKLAADLRSHGHVRDAPINAKVDQDIKEGEQYKEGQTAFVALAPLPSALSKQLQLVITTVSGVRVYLAVVDANEKGLESAPDSPRAARLKPLYALPPPRPLKCQRGTVLNAAEVNVLADELARSGQEPSHREWELLCLSDLPLLPSYRPEAEDGKSSLSRLRVPGVVLALAEDVHEYENEYEYELVSQHRVDPARARTFIVLTTSVAGVKRIIKRRPVDELQMLLEASSVSGLEPSDFFRRYGPDEACAMCLLSAISQPAISQPAKQAQLAEWARRGGEGASSAMAAGQGRAPNAAMVAQTAAAHGQAMPLAEKRYSGRHGGLCRVLARLLQPYWDRPLVHKVPEPSNSTGEELRLCEPRRERWIKLQGKLLSLISHIETHGEAWGRTGAAGYAGANPRASLGGGGAVGMHQLGQGLLGYAGANPRASLGGGGAVGMHQLGQGLLADPNVTQALRHVPQALRLGAVVSQGEADLTKLEADAIDALYYFARRAAEAATFLATIAADSPAPGGGGASVLEPARLHLLDSLAKPLDAPLREALLKMTFADLLVPHQRDAHGRPQPDKWDSRVEIELPKKLFMAFGKVEGVQRASQLQDHCQTFFSDAHKEEQNGWTLLKNAVDKPEQRTDDVKKALNAFGRVAAHIDLPQVLDALLINRAKFATDGTTSAAVLKELDKGIASLPLAAARADDPTRDASSLLGIASLPLAAARADDPTRDDTSLLVAGGGAMAGEPMAIIKGWPAMKKECLVRRLSRYHLLFQKGEELQKPQKPKKPSSAPTPHDNDTWFQVLAYAMRQQPVDQLFHYAACYWLLYRQPAEGPEMLLRLAHEESSPFPETFERFVKEMQGFKVRTTTQPEYRQEERDRLHALVRAHEVWSRFVFVSSQESFATLDKLMESTPDDSKWRAVEEELDSGELLPRLYVKQKRFLEAAKAFADLAEQPPAPTAPGLAAPTNPPPAPSAEELYQRRRHVEKRVRYLENAKFCAQDGGLGADERRSLEDNLQRGKLQIDVAKGLEKLLDTTNPPPRDTEELRKNDHFHAQVCGRLIDINALFKGAWEARLWWPSLAILDFSRPYREYPLLITTALQEILGQPPSVWEPAARAAVRERAELQRAAAAAAAEVVKLRKHFPNEYAFQADAVIACLETHELARKDQATPGEVVKMFCAGGAGVQPPVLPLVPWHVLYQCYGSSERCGPLMQKLWAGSRGDLGHPVAQKLHLIGGVKELLDRWKKAARVEFMAEQRQLGIASDLTLHITFLDSIGSAFPAEFIQSARDLRGKVFDHYNDLGR